MSDFRVTRSLLVGKVGPGGRLQEERRILREQFPSFRLRAGSDGSFAVATGDLRTFAGRSYAVRITLPSGYPHRAPAVNPDEWTPRSNPHVYTNGELCIMRADQWRDFMTVAFVVAKSALWLNKYEVWLDKRIWPGAEQHVHGPVYKLRKSWHGLG